MELSPFCHQPHADLGKTVLDALLCLVILAGYIVLGVVNEKVPFLVNMSGRVDLQIHGESSCVLQ